MNNKRIFIAGIVLLVGFFIYRAVCPSLDWSKRVEASIQTMLDEHGGFPKENTHLIRVENGLTSTHPVSEWSVHDVRIRNIPDLADFDPRYVLSAHVKVKFADGTDEQFDWTAIQRGYVLCNCRVIGSDSPRRPISIEPIPKHLQY